MAGVHRTGEKVDNWDDELEQSYEEKLLKFKDNYILFLDLLDSNPGETFLDIGCSNGLLLAEALRLGLEATGIDNTPEVAAISQKTAPRAKVVIGSETELPFDSEQFHIVTSFGISRYFSDPEKGIREIYRVLKTGGKACILLPNADFIGFKNRKNKNNPLDEEEETFFSLKTWKEIILESGLKIKSLHPDLKYLKNQDLKAYWDMKTPLFKGMGFLWRLLPLRWTYQFVCYCCKD